MGFAEPLNPGLHAVAEAVMARASNPYRSFVARHLRDADADLQEVENRLAVTTNWMARRNALAAFRDTMLKNGFLEGWSAHRHTEPSGAKTVSQFCRDWGMGRATVYAYIAAGKIRAVKRGRSTLILAKDEIAFAASLREVTFQPAGRKTRFGR